jgi:hypothetical protein
MVKSMWGMYRALKYFSRKEIREMPLARGCRWEDNIQLDIKEIGCVGVDWNKLAQDRHKLRGPVNTIMNFQVP